MKKSELKWKVHQQDLFIQSQKNAISVLNERLLMRDDRINDLKKELNKYRIEPGTGQELDYNYQNQKIADLEEALDRRRQLYKSMEELVNRKQPKSMEAMAAEVYYQAMETLSHFECTHYDSLSDEEKDKWMDALLKIIG